MTFEAEERLHFRCGRYLEHLTVLDPPFASRPNTLVGQRDSVQPAVFELLNNDVLHKSVLGLEFAEVDHPLQHTVLLFPEKDLLLKERGFLAEYLEFHQVFRRPVRKRNDRLRSDHGGEADEDGRQKDRAENPVEGNPGRLQRDQLAVGAESAECKQGREQRAHGERQDHHLRKPVDEETGDDAERHPLFDDQVGGLKKKISGHEDHREGSYAEKKRAREFPQHKPVKNPESRMFSHHGLFVPEGSEVPTATQRIFSRRICSAASRTAPRPPVFNVTKSADAFASSTASAGAKAIPAT